MDSLFHFELGGPPENKTFTTFDMFLRLSSLGNIQGRDNWLDLDRSLQHISVVTAAPPTYLESLPAELMDQILSDNALSPQDIINLSVCSTRFWPCVLRMVSSRFVSAASQWSNTPLICACSHVQSFPAVMNRLFPNLETEEKAYRESPSRVQLENPAADWIQQAFQSFTVALDPVSERQRWLDAVDSLCVSDIWPADGVAPVKTCAALRSMLDQATRVEFPLAGERWVLRNFTKMKYIRIDVLEGRENSVIATIAGYPSLGLDVAFLFLASWLCVSPGPDGCSLMIHNTDPRHTKLCAWAGDCFDIARLSVQERAIEAWADATDDVGNWLSNWRPAWFFLYKDQRGESIQP